MGRSKKKSRSEDNGHATHAAKIMRTAPGKATVLVRNFSRRRTTAVAESNETAGKNKMK